jgi:protein phosphatase
MESPETMRVFAWASTDVGQRRHANEDSYLWAPDLGLVAVADGMGGHRGGRLASSMAVETLDVTLRASWPGRRARGVSGFDVAALLHGSMRHANARIHAHGSADPDVRGMGTTASALLFDDERAIVAHVGDSRVYRVRDGRIEQLSRDHTLVAQQVAAGLITPEEAARSPWKNIIVRSVGVEPTVEVDVDVVPLRRGDVFVLCSDGLSGVVTDDEIAAEIARGDLHRAPDRLIDLANERGGPDNITVVVACALPLPER